MKAIEKNIKNSEIRRANVVLGKQNQPFLDKKLEQANQLLKKVGLPKEIEK